jgi:hypothetical protein
MTYRKDKRLVELKRMVNRSITGFPGAGPDATTTQVNWHLSRAYKHLCMAYNVGHGWLIKGKKR